MGIDYWIFWVSDGLQMTDYMRFLRLPDHVNQLINRSLSLHTCVYMGCVCMLLVLFLWGALIQVAVLMAREERGPAALLA